MPSGVYQRKHNPNVVSEHRPGTVGYSRDYQKYTRAKNAEQVRGYKLKYDFGITTEQYDSMFSKQDGKCAICKNPETAKDVRAKKTKRLAVDHCHKTNVIRGLLCQNCNQAIGKFKDNVDTMTSAIQYLLKKSGA